MHKKQFQYSTIFIFIAFISIKIIAQDVQFTQTFSLPLYLNPAYTGNTESHRLAMKYRNQWPGVSKAFTNIAASYDYNASKLNSGIGLLFLKETMGSVGFTNTNLRLLYSYNFYITREQSIRLGLNVDYVQKQLDASKLIFNDQLYTKNSQSFEQLYSNGASNYFDGGFGALYSHIGGWLGASVNHLSRPSISTFDRKSRLPMYWNVHGGLKLVAFQEYIEAFKYAYIWASYRHQANFNQLDIGAQFIINGFTVGATYRGVPIQKKLFIDRNDALAVTLGYNIPVMNMRVGYSYDMTISRLSIKSSGSHEVSLIFEDLLTKNRKQKKQKALCPYF